MLKNISAVDKNMHNHIYTASKIKHHLTIFREKPVKLSKHEFIHVIFMKLDSGNNLQQISIRLALKFATRHGKNTLTPKMSLFTVPLWRFYSATR